MVEIILTDEAVGWYEGLTEEQQGHADKAIARLEAFGVRLGFPYCSDIKESTMGIRELRVGGQPLRMLYAFDPRRDAVILLGGDKSGNERRWYAENTARAEKIWTQYLEEQGWK